MKTVTKLFATTLTAFAILSTSNLKAQTMGTTEPMTTGSGMAFKIGVGVNGGLFPDKSEMDYGYGADVKLQYDLSPYVALTASGVIPD